MRIILVGSIGRFPVAGHAWINLQYLRGFAALGHDVFYLEDAGDASYVYHWDKQTIVHDLDYPGGFIHRAMQHAGLTDRWAYRAGDQTRGAPTDRIRRVCGEADLLLVRGAPMARWLPEYLGVPRRVYLDVDPMFTQVEAARADSPLRQTIDRSTDLFTIAARCGAPDCHVPDLGRAWHPTLSPVHLPDWPWADDDAKTFTTVMQWNAYKAVEWEGRRYGNKMQEFPRFTDVARRIDADFLIAMTGRPPEQVDTRGWKIIDGHSATATLEDYRRFIQSSYAEFSAAKQGYVVSRGGWFSDRSVCYLASGRPVVVQDTGLSDWLPVGEGLLTFSDLDQAVHAVRTVRDDYPRHRRAARRIAEDHFSTDRVLADLLAKLR